MSIPFLAALAENGPHSLAFSQYLRDYQATRDRSVATGALFTFKDMAVDAVQAATPTRRGVLQRYLTTVFGEVDVVLDLVRKFAFIRRISTKQILFTGWETGRVCTPSLPGGSFLCCEQHIPVTGR